MSPMLVFCRMQRADSSCLSVSPLLTHVDDEEKHGGEEEQNTVAYRTTIQATEIMVYRDALRKPLLSRS